MTLETIIKEAYTATQQGDPDPVEILLRSISAGIRNHACIVCGRAELDGDDARAEAVRDYVNALCGPVYLGGDDDDK